MTDFERLRQDLAAVRIAHHLPGRIRLSFSGAAADRLPPVDMRRLQQLLESLEGVRTLRLNLLARSCTIEYDPQRIPDNAWADYLAGVDSAAAAEFDILLREKYREFFPALA